MPTPIVWPTARRNVNMAGTNGRPDADTEAWMATSGASDDPQARATYKSKVHPSRDGGIWAENKKEANAQGRQMPHGSYVDTVPADAADQEARSDDGEACRHGIGKNAAPDNTGV